MKSTQVTDELKKEFNIKSNDEIIPAIKAALTPRQPDVFTITLTVVSGRIMPTVSGLSNPATAQQIELVQAVCRRYAGELEATRTELVKREIRAELERESDD